MENKTNRSNIFWDLNVHVSFRIISFSSLDSEFSFDSEDSEINFDRARSTTANSLLIEDVSRFACKSILLHRGRLAYTIRVDSPTLKSFRLHLKYFEKIDDHHCPQGAEVFDHRSPKRNIRVCMENYG